MFSREQYSPVALSANQTYNISSGTRHIGGFLCVTAGTLTVKNNRGDTIVNALPVSAGVYYPLPYFLDVGGSGQVILAGGASGTLGI